MIGQEELLKTFNGFTVHNLPHTLMLVGETGCGKHTLVGMLSDNLNLPIENISGKLSYDKLVELTLRSAPYIYLIDTNVSLAAQNSLLKFIEEPPSTAYVVIVTESENNFLNTITGRCRIYRFKEYSESELLNFSTNRDIIETVRTPGKILSVIGNQWVFDLNKTILTKISDASIPNTLTLAEKFNFGKDENKFNIDTEMSMLRSACLNEYVKTNNPAYLSAFEITSEYISKLKIANVDKKKLFCLYLLELKGSMKK